MAGVVPIHNASKKAIICAIDFGTSRSGYGYMLVDDDNIVTESFWDNKPESEIFCKTLTQILYEDDKPIAWGFSAPKKMAEIAEKAEIEGVELPPAKYALLKYFKMALRNPTGVFQHNPHRSFNVVDVISEYLKLIWAKLEARLTTNLKKNVSISEIKWSLTIPAIWSDVEKASMRRAAFKAGLIEKENVSEDHFMLVLEPEAAAAWCLEERKKTGTPLLDGESFLVVDAGGGTVDLTAHVLVGGKLKELTVGSGGACGSSEINASFWKYFKEVICNNNADLDAFGKESPLAELELTNAFDQSKCQVEDYVAIRNIKVPDQVAALLDSLPQRPAMYVQKHKMLRLTGPALQTIFEPTITAIEDLVRQQFAANAALGNKQFDYIFLVGGFGSSQLLLKHLKAKFSSGINLAENVQKVIQPSHPGMAVISGAVLLGKDPSLIRIRKIRATYGIGAVVQFIPGTHKEDKKTTLPGKPGFWCKDFVDKFVANGEEVEVDKSVVRVYSPQAANQQYMSLTLFTSPLSRATYTDEPGVKKLGEIIIEMLDTTGGLNRSVEVNMYFGKSEIKVTAIEGISKKRYEAYMNFESKALEYTGPTVPQAPTKSYHLIFLNDVSGSMCLPDAQPSLSWMQHRNRVGALYESCFSFLQSRIGTADIVSCILTLFSRQTNNPEALTRDMMTVPAGGGNHFGRVMEELERLLNAAPTATHIPIAFFMTDGGCCDCGASANLRRIMGRYEASGFTFHSVLVGRCSESELKLLQLLAQIGKGTMNTSSITLADMKKTYAALAALLN